MAAVRASSGARRAHSASEVHETPETPKRALAPCARAKFDLPGNGAATNTQAKATVAVRVTA
jgi:hypothetical protein